MGNVSNPGKKRSLSTRGGGGQPPNGVTHAMGGLHSTFRGGGSRKRWENHYQKNKTNLGEMEPNKALALQGGQEKGNLKLKKDRMRASGAGKKSLLKRRRKKGKGKLAQ